MRKIFGISILAIFMACNQADKRSTETKDSLKQDSALVLNDVSIKDQKKSIIFTQYQNLKNALVNSDPVSAQKYADQLQMSLINYKGYEPIAAIAKKIASSTDLNTQRKSFTILSADLIFLFKGATIQKGVIYVQHCPMANKGDGGDWLSTEKEIRNPYYGKEMLECGRVVEEIKAK